MQWILDFKGRHRLAVAALAACAVLVGASLRASAQNVACETLDDDPLLPTIYGIGGSAGKELIKRISIALAGDPSPIRVVFAAPGACNALNALVGADGSPDGITAGPVYYWDPDGTEHQCDLPIGGIPADWGYMAQNPEICPAYPSGIPATIGNFEGPISGWSIITHPDSTQASISSEALYLAYGFGNSSQAAPWTDEAYLFRRNSTSAALLAISAATTLPATSFLGTDVGTNQAMISSVAGALVPSAALGFVSSEVADAARDTLTPVKTLAYQHVGQSCGYWPDSTPNAYDKINIRDGHYWLWANHRFYAAVDGVGAITDADVARFVGHVTGSAAPTAAVPNLELIIQANTIPTCAMHVTRVGDYTELQSFQPDDPCGCYFDFVATGATTCTECVVDGDCSATQSCSYGYCEEG